MSITDRTVRSKSKGAAKVQKKTAQRHRAKKGPRCPVGVIPVTGRWFRRLVERGTI